MSLHDDFDIEITENEDSELSEKEYSDILGLDGMAGGGETALTEETEEEKDEPVYVVPVEEIKQKSKQIYRRYSMDEEEVEPEEEVSEPHKIPLDQIVSWKNSSISEQEAYSDEKYVSSEYWNYLQTNVSDYARSVQLENEKLYKDVDVAGISSVYAHFEPVNEIPRTQAILHQESMQIPILEQYTSPNKSFRQEEMVEVFSYAKKQEDKGTSSSTFTPIKSSDRQEVAQGQTEKTTRDVNVAGQSHAEGQRDTAAEQGKVDIVLFESNELPTSSTGAHYGSYWTRLSKFKSNPEAWNDGWTDNYIAWANSLYNQNWTNLYGVDPLGGISMCARFTEEEIAVILAENGLTGRTSPQYRACYFALSKVGYPYSKELRDSGTAYDCSSLCYYAWAYAGKNLVYEGSNTAAQEAKGLVNNGILVYDSTDSGSSYNQGNLQSGDLIFYSYEDNDRYLDISHVAFYIGNGMVVEARGRAYGVVYREVPNISKIVLVCRVRY